MPAPTLTCRLEAAATEGLAPNIRRWLAFAGHQEGEWIEFQALHVPDRRWRSNRFAHARSVDVAIELLEEADAFLATGVYLVVNRVNPAVATREMPGHWHIAKKGESTSDADIVARQFLYINLDAKRPKGTSSTREELLAALHVLAQVYDLLVDLLGATTSLAVGMSGNGGAILVALEDLPVSVEVSTLVKGILAALSALHTTSAVEIDTSVCDLKRLAPAWGTTKRKGAEGIEERPHRRTALITPDRVERVGLGALQRLMDGLLNMLTPAQRASIDRASGRKPAGHKSPPKSGGADDVFARANECDVLEVLTNLGLYDAEGITCPGCRHRGDSSVAVVGNGVKCLHNTCAKRGKSGFRSVVDLVMEQRDLSNIDAVRLLGEWFSFAVPSAKGSRAGRGAVTAPPRGSEAKRDGMGDGDDGEGNAGDAQCRPVITVTTELAAVVDASEHVLLADPGANLYTRGGLLTRIVRDGTLKVPGLTRPTEAPVIIEAPIEYLRERLTRLAVFNKMIRAKSGDEILVPSLPPEWIAKTLRARGEWPFPPIEGVTETPALRADGTVLDRPGYDAASALLFDPGATVFPMVPQAPSRSDAEAAYAALCEPFVDFPFVSTSDRVAAIAAILTIVGRPAIAGPVPAFAFRATTPGTGKGLCADVVTLAATGRPAAVMVAPRDDDEARKSILAIGLEAAPVVLLDNIEGAIGSPSIAAALTAQVFKGRILGASRNVAVVLRSVWLFTGNNIAFKGDLGRRVVPIDMDAKCEHPEDRGSFTHSNLREHALASRPALVTAALTILAAYHRAGRPPHGEQRKGSFESWDDLVRGALMWVGAGDPLAGCERVRKEADGDLEVLRGLLGAWAHVFDDRPQTVAALLRKAAEEPDFKTALAQLDPRGDGDRLNPRVVGKALARLRGRIVDGRRIERGPDYQGSATWMVGAP